MKNQNDLSRGLVYALITAVISGVAIFYSKISVAKIDPLAMATSRNLYVGIVFFIGMFLFGRLKELKTITKKDLIKLILIGVIGGGVPFYLFFTGLQSIGAQSGNIIHKSLFIWVSILSILFLKEKISKKSAIIYVLIFIGTYFFTPIKFVLDKGTILAMVATLLWSVENIIAKKTLRNISSQMVGLFRMGIGSLILVAITLFTGKTGLLLTINNQQLTMIIIGGSILTFYVYFWYKALKYAPANLVTLILTFSLVTGNILSSSFAGVKLTNNDIYSSLFIGVAIFLLIFRLLRQSDLQPDRLTNGWINGTKIHE